MPADNFAYIDVSQTPSFMFNNTIERLEEERPEADAFMFDAGADTSQLGRNSDQDLEEQWFTSFNGGPISETNSDNYSQEVVDLSSHSSNLDSQSPISTCNPSLPRRDF